MFFGEIICSRGIGLDMNDRMINYLPWLLLIICFFSQKLRSCIFSFVYDDIWFLSYQFWVEFERWQMVKIFNLLSVIMELEWSRFVPNTCLFFRICFVCFIIIIVFCDELDGNLIL